MNNRVTFPDFSAFQIDIAHGPWSEEAPGAGDRHPDPDLFSAFWPEFPTRQEREREQPQKPAAED
ncbi:hypothetical protein [Arthrobacter sp. StoSoilB20]|uniref:hypothetical protein n=1 Tax=Arthrobacter sp. StoSoilB20 TaxID=2830995 RepID=UPI001CC64CFA|nr:hypothetical protein [Arthrobacter sp. StoSoilB20]BCW56854.1 hypothetical protein StoSoilB20_02010 [Arthrobacter sp. StoSoilB20]